MLGWQTFDKNANYRDTLLVSKALNNDAPGYMKDIFKYVEQVSTQTLRSSAENKLYLQKVYPQSIKFCGPRIWNSFKYSAKKCQISKAV